MKIKQIRIARRHIGHALCAILLASLAGAAFAQVDPHLDILAASIREVPPLDPVDVGSRTVAIKLQLAAAPVCDAASFVMAYGALIDSDLEPLTGVTDPAFDPLGMDARISAECDQATGLFVSGAGPVVIGPPAPGGEVLLTITTTVAGLPAVEFHWIAFAMDGGNLTRLPSPPTHAVWGIHERRIP